VKHAVRLWVNVDLSCISGFVIVTVVYVGVFGFMLLSLK